METHATTTPTNVDAAPKNSAPEQRKRHKHKALIGPLKRFCERVLTGLAIVSSDSSFGSDSDDESNKRTQNQHQHIVEWGNMHAPNGSMDSDVEISLGNSMGNRNRREYVDTLGYYDDEDMAETIEDDIHIRSNESFETRLDTTHNNADGSTIIVEFQNKYHSENGDIDRTDSIILQEVKSIETEFVRPSVACCYCAGPVPGSPMRKRSPTKKKNIDKHRIRNNNHKRRNRKRVEMTSMLSDDDDKDDFVDENTSGVYNVTSDTIEECEAKFMQEIESSQCEHFNLENSHWRKGFDFVRS